MKLFEKANQYDSSKSMYEYGKIHYKLYKVSGLDVDKEKAIEFYKKSIDRGNFKAMLNYGIMIKDDKSLEQNNIEEGANFIKMSADAKSMLNYACSLLERYNFEANKDEILEYLKMSIDRGEEMAMNKYAHILYNKILIEENIEDKIKYLKISINRGNIKAMAAYADILFRGDEVDQNKEESFKYL